MNYVEKAKELIIKNWGIVLVLGTLLLYILIKSLLPGKQYDWINLLFGAIIFFEIISLVILEIKHGVKTSGWKHEIVDTLIAIGIAIAIWFGAQAILGTSSPISGVVSCSMLPELERGDFVVVQGGEIEVSEVELTEAELYQITNGPFVARSEGIEQSYSRPFHTYCLCNPRDETCIEFMNSEADFYETAGPATYHHTWCDVDYTTGQMPERMRCVDYVEIKGKRFYMADEANNVIVYNSRSTDLYSRVGDIVHRSVARLKVDDKVYYLTGGDNNPVLDNQVYECSTGMGNQPVLERNVKGKVIIRIPYLGYLKLFISGFWSEDEQCSWILER